MVILVYGCDGVILVHTLQRQNVYVQYFRQFLAQPEMSVAKKGQQFFQNPPIILQDNTWAHVSHPVAVLYRHWSSEVLFHPPYSPDLSP